MRIVGTKEYCEFPNLVVSNLVVCNFYAEALFCAHLRSFALICAHLRSFARICVFVRPTAFRTTAFGNCREKDKIRTTPSFALAMLIVFFLEVVR